MEEEALNTPPTKQFPSITFSYIHGNGFDPAWVESVIWLLLQEVSKPKEERILGSILKAGSCYVDSNRDKVAIDFMNNSQDDWLLMIEPDIQFAPNILELLSSHIQANPEAQIIAGRVNLLNGLPVFYKFDAEKKNQIHQPFAFEGLREFDLVGTGIICIHRNVFKALSNAMGNAHFFYKILYEGHVLGDGFSFCMRVRQLGFKIYGAWNIFGQHWKPMPCPQRYVDMNDLIPK